MNLLSTETKTTGSTAIIVVGPSEANWIMAKEGSQWPKLLDQFSLQLSEGFKHECHYFTWSQTQKLSWKVITSRKAFLTSSKVVWLEHEGPMTKPKLLVCLFLKVANLLFISTFRYFLTFKAPKPSVIAVL